MRRRKFIEMASFLGISAPFLLKKSPPENPYYEWREYRVEAVWEGVLRLNTSKGIHPNYLCMHKQSGATIYVERVMENYCGYVFFPKPLDFENKIKVGDRLVCHVPRFDRNYL